MATPHAGLTVRDIHLPGGVAGGGLIEEFHRAIEILIEWTYDIGPLLGGEVPPRQLDFRHIRANHGANDISLYVAG